jgi:hypothetical protein
VLVIAVNHLMMETFAVSWGPMVSQTVLNVLTVRLLAHNARNSFLGIVVFMQANKSVELPIPMVIGLVTG